jgi:hypothetical protein
VVNCSEFRVVPFFLCSLSFLAALIEATRRDRAFAGVQLEELDINRSPVQTVFQAICSFNSSSRDGARQLGLNRDALRQNVTFLTQQATQGVKMAGFVVSYGMTMLQNFQASSPSSAEIGTDSASTRPNSRRGSRDAKSK